MLLLNLAFAAPMTDWIVVRLDEEGAMEGQVLAGDGRTVRIHAQEDAVVEARELMRQPGVVWAEPDWILELTPTLDDPYLPDQWHLENTGQNGLFPGVDLNAPAAWDLTSGEGVIIAIVDSGVDPNHPDLDQVAGWDYVDGDADPTPDPESDSFAHGTACAGVAAAVGDNGLGGVGVAWGAQIMPVRLLGGNTYTSDVHDAWIEAAEGGAKVISNSWSYSAQTCDGVPSIYLLELAMKEVDELGSLLVMSAGNAGCDMSNDGIHQNPELTSVGAITDQDVLTWYSNYGELVDVVAPSGGIITTDIVGEGGYSHDDYYWGYSGTSASAPMVAGVYALMFSVNERLSPEAAREALCWTAVRNDPVGGEWDSEGRSPWYGCGRADAGAAVASVYNEGPPVAQVADLAAFKDEAWLRWSAIDPDGDGVWWELEVDGERVQEGPQSSFLLDEEELKVGDVVEFTVTPWDLWGPGEPASATFEVLRKPRAEEPTGVCGPGVGAGPGVLVLCALLARRRVNERGALS